MPFRPGGLDDISLDPVFSLDPILNSKKGLRKVAPGLSRGLRLPGNGVEDEELVNELDEVRMPAPEASSDDEMVHYFACSIHPVNRSKHQDRGLDEEQLILPPGNEADIDELLPTTVGIILSTHTRSSSSSVIISGPICIRQSRTNERVRKSRNGIGLML